MFYVFYNYMVILFYLFILFNLFASLIPYDMADSLFLKLEREWVTVVKHQMNFLTQYHSENKWYLMRWCLHWTRPTRLLLNCYVIHTEATRRYNVSMLFYSDILPMYMYTDPKTSMSFLLLLNVVCSAEKQHIPVTYLLNWPDRV